ncbi:uncharacterized protein SCHCODRAFT_02627940 [Schizophyllum commune H4-8]|uniref:WW domain-containing protein n=1 Tax=Schizophyllum commune (strain H4-8 / FGSC 9210) TaxID=578458 RepID=D8Q6A7_SCHCM|nr:uncharacterized protein SCHCODRAFT_02627940 [Schizophyllum commune H4-8]KAI5891031.1 hypothetical protein SCHCODRAFT_02627940 [Schizophyllum commune H4-8]
MSSPTPDPSSSADDVKAQDGADAPQETEPASSKHEAKGKDREAAAEDARESSESDGEKQQGSNDGEEEPASPEPSTSQQQPSAEGTPWQAVFAPQYNAYYFYNSQTGETTWTNPLDPSASASTSNPAAGPSASTTATTTTTTASPPPTGAYTALQQTALAQGIDPALAHLDPSLTSATPNTASTSAFVAKFNARTGAFTGASGRDPSHLSEYERMRRMNSVFFDMDKWEQEAAARAEAEEAAGKKRKRPTKKDLERFKEQKRQKKIAKTAWLRT